MCGLVTGVPTCALPISPSRWRRARRRRARSRCRDPQERSRPPPHRCRTILRRAPLPAARSPTSPYRRRSSRALSPPILPAPLRSEERRVGKEDVSMGSSRLQPSHQKKEGLSGFIILCLLLISYFHVLSFFYLNV